MQVMLEKLLALPDLQCISVAAGSKGLKRTVRWTATAESPEFKSFVRENELVFTTGVGAQTQLETLFRIVESVCEVNAAGIVLNLGPYIASVPEEILLFAEKNSFPVLTMPWEARIADITHTICEHIIRSGVTDRSLLELLRQALRGDSLTQEELRMLDHYGFLGESGYCVMVCAIEGISPPQQQSICATLQSVLTGSVRKATFFGEKEYYCFVLPHREGDTAQQILDLFGRILDDAAFRDVPIRVRAGMSERCESLNRLGECNKQALQAFKIASHQGSDAIVVLDYGSLGLYRLFGELTDKNALDRFYQAVLGPLDAYDKVNAAGCLDFLKVYLEEDGSTGKIGQRLFLHRNSVLYKINKIEDILGCRLSSLQSVSEITLAMAIRDIL